MNIFLADRVANLAACYRSLQDYKKAFTGKTFSNEIEKYIETVEPGYFPTFLIAYQGNTMEITPKFPRLFELCAMSTTLESYYRGVDQFPPGFFLEKMEYTQFAIFAHYSSIFHLIDSFLSIHGLVFIPSPKDDVETISTPKPVGLPERLVHMFPTITVGELKKRKGEPIKAIKATARLLTKDKNKRWIFEPTNLKHETRWEEFGKLLQLYVDNGLSSQISRNFRCLIEYFGNHMFMGSPEWGEYDAVGNDDHLKILLPKACRSVARIRHEAVYKNEAWDRAAKYASKFLEKQDLHLDPLKLKIYHIKNLNIALLKWQTELIHSLLEETKKQLDNATFSDGYEKSVSLIELMEMSSKHISEEESGFNLVDSRIKDIIWGIIKIKLGEATTRSV